MEHVFSYWAFVVPFTAKRCFHSTECSGSRIRLMISLRGDWSANWSTRNLTLKTLKRCMSARYAFKSTPRSVVWRRSLAMRATTSTRSALSTGWHKRQSVPYAEHLLTYKVWSFKPINEIIIHHFLLHSAAVVRVSCALLRFRGEWFSYGRASTHTFESLLERHDALLGFYWVYKLRRRSSATGGPLECA